MNTALEITGLCKNYGAFALKNVSFSLSAGYIMGLVGQNGAGKTTLIKLILNLLIRDAGEIRIFGLDQISHEIEVRARIGFVHEVPSYYGYLTLEKMKSLISPFRRRWDEPLFQQLSREFELPLDRKIGALSRGMTMKFSLALALSHDADLLVLDEPTTGLDPVFRRELLERLSALIQDEGKAVLFSTQITTDLDRIADYITYIRNGELLFSSTREEISERWAIVRGDSALLDAETRTLFHGVLIGEAGFRALTADAAQARRRFEGKAVVIEKASLDDMMFHLNRGNGHD
jgi:ABC-2 type transport system ATP-binding protein